MSCLVVYASLSHVYRVKRALYGRGAFVEMVRAPQCLAMRGCSFGLRAEADLVASILETSRACGVETRGAFRETQEGYEPLP
jgi:hypothetical protein